MSSEQRNIQTNPELDPQSFTAYMIETFVREQGSSQKFCYAPDLTALPGNIEVKDIQIQDLSGNAHTIEFVHLNEPLSFDHPLRKQIVDLKEGDIIITSDLSDINVNVAILPAILRNSFSELKGF